MNVVVINGSPRKNGNSASLADTLASTLQDKGAEVTSHFLNSLSYRGCQACQACKITSKKCILRDDLAVVLDDFYHADIAVLATPVYWGEVSSQMKGFIDRLYSFLTPDFMTAERKHRLPGGKKLVFIQTQGAADDSMYRDIFERYNGFFEKIEMFEAVYFMQGSGLSQQSELDTRPDLYDKLATIAAQL
ncbi:MAG: flavodoxin family protein [Desulfobulbaceae bacterium]|nr:MAG: flavodoxin family protein [Desulfobulbaceae bacterium]